MERSWGHLGALLGPSWGVLGGLYVRTPSWRLLGLPWWLFFVYLASLGAFLGLLGPLLGPLALNLAIFVDFLGSRGRFLSISGDFGRSRCNLKLSGDR